MSNFSNHPEGTPAQRGSFVTRDGAAFGPCLLISRECGSGGSPLARRVGERLGWNFFDAKIVDEITRSANIEQRLIQSVDEHVRSHWERTWRDFLLDDLAEEKYFHHLKQVVTALGHHGNVVIVGRGAQHLLPPQSAVSVRLVAPLHLRVQRVAETEGLTPVQARLKVAAIDKDRAIFIRKIFKKDAGSPMNHDLMINTAEISLENAAEIVLTAIGQKLGVTCQESPVAHSD